MFQKINSHNEWDKIKEIIVGTGKNSTATLPENDKEVIKKLEQAIKLAKEAYPQWLYDEIEEDLDGLAATLKDLGAVVHRPKAYDLTKIYSSPYWHSNSNNLYNARDLNLVVGNSVIESPSYYASRYYETTGFYEIFYKYFEKGFKWIAGPKPKLDYDAVLPYFKDHENRELTSEDTKHKNLTKGRLEKLHRLAEKEFFEAANDYEWVKIYYIWYLIRKLSWSKMATISIR